MKPTRGTVIAGRYELLEEIGEGGMATVWRAIIRGAAGFARPAAVKVMRPELKTLSTYLDMFVDEARIGAELHHPNLVQVFDFVEQDQSYCLVMEWVEGVDLRRLLQGFTAQGRATPWPIVAHVAVEVLRGLAAAHERSRDGAPAPVVHRDVSPQNILCGLNGAVKLGDFGIAFARNRVAKATEPGVVKGKFHYLAPELLASKPASAQSDLFSLGCTLWEAIAGEKLFQGKSDSIILGKIFKGEVRPLHGRRADVPPRMVDVVHRALAHDPRDRFPSARVMSQELQDVLRTTGPSVDPRAMMEEAVAAARSS